MSAKLNNVRTRFAPSPTGFLHIGGARTALFNFLFARHHGGKFVLRIEDTDKQRSTQASTDAILSGMRWLGLDWDEGPFLQSDRTVHYQAAIEKLLKEGNAYVCDCSQEMVEAKRQAASKSGKKPMYDRTCRDRSLKREPGRVVRLKAPLEGTTVVNDLIKGVVTFQNSELDDMVLTRGDGSPTYNFVVVVDDLDMQISHVIRGDDHLNNTPKQILIYQAFKAKLPEFAHVPLILGEDKSRLSKRHGATSLEQYRDAGLLPEAMLNFLARLGWSHGDEEVFSLADLIGKFSLENVGKSAGVFNDEKLLWLNHHYLRQLPIDQLTSMITPYLQKRFGESAIERLTTPEWQLLLPELRERCKTLEEFGEHATYFFVNTVNIEALLRTQHLTPTMLPVLQSLRTQLKNLTTFDQANIEAAFKKVLEETGEKMKTVAQAVRVALTGSTVSPGIYLLVQAVGKEQTLQRLESALKMVPPL